MLSTAEAVDEDAAPADTLSEATASAAIPARSVRYMLTKGRGGGTAFEGLSLVFGIRRREHEKVSA